MQKSVLKSYDGNIYRPRKMRKKVSSEYLADLLAAFDLSCQDGVLTLPMINPYTKRSSSSYSTTNMIENLKKFYPERLKAIKVVKVTALGSQPMKTIKTGLFGNIGKQYFDIQEVDFVDSKVSTICQNAFFGNRHLSKLKFGGYVSNIGEGAFVSTSLKSVDFQLSVGPRDMSLLERLVAYHNSKSSNYFQDESSTLPRFVPIVLQGKVFDNSTTLNLCDAKYIKWRGIEKQDCIFNFNLVSKIENCEFVKSLVESKRRVLLPNDFNNDPLTPAERESYNNDIEDDKGLVRFYESTQGNKDFKDMTTPAEFDTYSKNLKDSYELAKKRISFGVTPEGPKFRRTADNYILYDAVSPRLFGKPQRCHPVMKSVYSEANEVETIEPDVPVNQK